MATSSASTNYQPLLPEVLAGALQDAVHVDPPSGRPGPTLAEVERLREQVATLTRERDEARQLLAEWLAGPMSDANYDAGLGKRTRATLAEFDGEAGEP